MEPVELNAQVRATTGKCPARQLRRDGKIPAIVYGPESEPIMVTVNIRDLEKAIKKTQIGQLILNLHIQNGSEKVKMAMIKELQKHPVSRSFLHVDFYEISMDRKINVKVPIVPVGKSKGVEFGGMLQIIRRELEILCYPGQIPEKIEIDITDLDMGESIHVKDIQIEGDIEIPAEVNFTVITILSPKTEEPEEAEEGEEAEEAEEAEAGEASVEE